jgi:uncharacterized protein (DUF1810 family)
LGKRLRACIAALQDHTGTTAENIFGEVDAMKFKSSLTRFRKSAGRRFSMPPWSDGLLVKQIRKH